jgi:predicted Zn-dependent protease
VSDRRALLEQMASEFPDSAMAQFSLGSFWLEGGDVLRAIPLLERATALQGDYAAAWVALGDARSAAGRAPEAKAAWAEAKRHALAQGHQSLAEEIDRKTQAT